MFSLVLLAVELLEIRFPWRNFWLDWATATIVLAAYLAITAVLSGTSLVQLTVIVPQLVLSTVLFPVVARLVAQLDRLRLMRVRRIN